MLGNWKFDHYSLCNLHQGIVDGLYRFNQRPNWAKALQCEPYELFLPSKPGKLKTVGGIPYVGVALAGKLVEPDKDLDKLMQIYNDLSDEDKKALINLAKHFSRKNR
jgi:hypothetical protein